MTKQNDQLFVSESTILLGSNLRRRTSKTYVAAQMSLPSILDKRPRGVMVEDDD